MSAGLGHCQAEGSVFLKEPVRLCSTAAQHSQSAAQQPAAHRCKPLLPPLLPSLSPSHPDQPTPAVSASNQRKPSFSSAEVAQSVPVGPIPDCADNLFMRAGQPCYTFLYAPAVSAAGVSDYVSSASVVPALLCLPPPAAAAARLGLLASRGRINRLLGYARFAGRRPCGGGWAPVPIRFPTHTRCAVPDFVLTLYCADAGRPRCAGSCSGRARAQ